MLDLFTAIKARYNATDLKDNFTAISAGVISADARRPYAIAMPSSQVRTGRSNVGGYYQESFQVNVYDDDFENACRLADLLQERILTPALHFVGSRDRLMLVEEGNTVWRQEDQYWRVIVEFTAAVAKPGRSSSY